MIRPRNSLFALAALAWLLIAPASNAIAQQGAQLIGFIAPDEEPRFTNLLLGLRAGLKSGGAGNFTITERRVKRGDAATARDAAKSLSASRPLVVFVVGTELTRSIREVTRELPIVFITPGDPVRAGIAASPAINPLVTYGVSDVDIARSAALHVVRVLNGQSAGTIPIEQPTKFEFTIDLNAAKGLAINIPATVMLRADRVIK